MTGTIGTSTIGIGLAVAGSVGVAEGGGVAVEPAEAVGVVPVGPWPIGAPGLPEGVDEPASPPPMVRATAAASSTTTVTRGSRFTAAIVTAGHEERPAAKQNVPR